MRAFEIYNGIIAFLCIAYIFSLIRSYPDIVTKENILLMLMLVFWVVFGWLAVHSVEGGR